MLYDTEQFADVDEMLEEMGESPSQEQTDALLSRLQSEQDERVEWLLKIIANEQAMLEALNAEKKTISDRIAAKKRKIENIKEHCFKPFLDARAIRKHKTALGTISLRSNPAKFDVDATRVHEWPSELLENEDLVRVKFDVMKTELKQLPRETVLSLPGVVEVPESESVAIRR